MKKTKEVILQVWMLKKNITRTGAALGAMQEYADQFQSVVMPSDEEVENQLLTRFGFKGDTIDAKNQLKIFSFMDWFKSQFKPAENEEKKSSPESKIHTI